MTESQQWTEEQINELIRLRKNGQNLREISTALKRSSSAVKEQLMDLPLQAFAAPISSDEVNTSPTRDIFWSIGFILNLSAWLSVPVWVTFSMFKENLLSIFSSLALLTWLVLFAYRTWGIMRKEKMQSEAIRHGKWNIKSIERLKSLFLAGESPEIMGHILGENYTKEDISKKIERLGMRQHYSQGSKWTPEMEKRIIELADAGTDLALISKTMGEQYTIPSVRQKLVQLNKYTDYQEKRFEQSKAEYRKISEKLKKPDTFPNQTNLDYDENFVRILINNIETHVVEFKSSFQIDVESKQANIGVTHAVVKTIAGFLNSGMSSNLLIGVNDDGKIIGIFDDNYKGPDLYERKLRDILADSLGKLAGSYIRFHFVPVDQDEVCCIEIMECHTPIFCKHKKYNAFKKLPNDQEIYYKRQGNQTKVLQGIEMYNDISRRGSASGIGT